MVVDADALNIVSTNVSILKNCRGPRLLTPHPGEMKRLAGNQKNSRTELAEKFTGEFPITLLLKGSRTIVAEKGKFISYNTTGNPGMATGGMGDVLTWGVRCLTRPKSFAFRRLPASGRGPVAAPPRSQYSTTAKVSSHSCLAMC
jgi:NAD(P)H-hydrate epimerase